MDDGISMGLLIGLLSDMLPEVDPSVIESYVNAWLTAHPEATTTVQDGSITLAKLASDLAAKINSISSLSDEIDDLNSTLQKTVETIAYTTFVQGARKADTGGAITSNATRCTSSRLFALSGGDTISVSGIDNGLKVAIAGCSGTTAIMDSGWKTDNYSYTVDSTEEGNYFVNIAKSNGSDAIAPADISTLAITIKKANASLPTIDAKLINNKRNLIGKNIGKLYPVVINKGDTFTVSTSDGNAASVATGINLYNANREYIDYYTFPSGSASLTRVMGYNNVRFIVQEKTIGVPLQIEIGGIATEYQEYEEQDLDYAQQIAGKGYFSFSDIADMVRGTYGPNGYLDYMERLHYKNIYIPAHVGDRVIASSSVHNVLVAIVSDPQSMGEALYTSGWGRTHNITIQNNGYYVFLAQATQETFNASFTVIPASFANSDPAISSVFQSEITATVTSVRALQTEPSLVFPLCTDIHYGTAESGDNFLFDRSAQNMLSVMKQIRCDAVVCLGDITEGNSANTEAYAAKVNNMLRNLGKPYLLAIGNHDDNRYETGGTFTASEMYQYYNSFTENTVAYNASTNGRDFYVDYPAYKTRFIILDSNTVGAYGFASETVTWFTNTALDTPADYLAIVLVHESPIPAQNYNNSSVTNGTAIAEAIETYQTNGKPIIQLYGHSHCDVAFTTPYLSIGTNCLKFENTNGDPALWPSGAVKPSRTAGTASEDCWNVVVIRPASRKINFVRFGAGNDREYTY